MVEAIDARSLDAHDQPRVALARRVCQGGVKATVEVTDVKSVDVHNLL